MLADIAERCNTIEESYEFMLAYAAQGLPTDSGSQSGGPTHHNYTTPSHWAANPSRCGVEASSKKMRCLNCEHPN